MTTLTPQTVLRRATELSVVISATGDVLALDGGRTISCGPHGLAILDLYSVPTSLADALEALGGRVGGAQDWIDLTAAIVRLHESGVLIAPEDLETDVVVRGSFDSPGPHVAMLDDRVRTQAFLAALEEIVGPEDVVVDIGTGTGILAAGAARSGARHVYAVEATPIARHARAVFDANRLGDRVTIVEGWSTRVSLPERADIVVAEVLGSEALEERALQVLLDARRRHLNPGGRLIPAELKVFGVLVDIPEATLDEVTFRTSNTRRWSTWYGIDLEPLGTYSAGLRHRITAPIPDVRTWRTLSEPVPLAQYDFASLETAATDVSTYATASTSGRANGVFAFFDAQLSPGVALTTNPAAEPPVTSWGLPVWLLQTPRTLAEGERFGLRYEFRNGTGHLYAIS